MLFCMTLSKILTFVGPNVILNAPKDGLLIFQLTYGKKGSNDATSKGGKLRNVISTTLFGPIKRLNLVCNTGYAH